MDEYYTKHHLVKGKLNGTYQTCWLKKNSYTSFTLMQKRPYKDILPTDMIYASYDKDNDIYIIDREKTLERRTALKELATNKSEETFWSEYDNW